MDYRNSLIHFIFFLIYLTRFNSEQKGENIHLAMKNFGIVPNVIPVAPNETIEILYPKGGEIVPGKIMTPKQVDHVPYCNWPVVPDTYYTLCMTNPIFNPDGTEISEVVHWLVINVPLYDFIGGDLLFQYLSPTPPNNTNLYLYLFLAYAQPRRIRGAKKTVDHWTMEGRENFSIYQFAQKYNFDNPVAGNFFYARYSQYVLKIYRKRRGEIETDEELEEFTLPPYYS